MKVILIDADDTLFNSSGVMLAAMNSEFPQHKIITRDDLTSYDAINLLFDTSVEQFLATIKKHGCIETAPLVRYARTSIAGLKSAGYSVIVLTARGWHPKGKELTEKRLTDAGVNVPVEVVDIGGSKREAIERLISEGHEIIGFIDDAGHHIESCLDLVKHSVLIDAPYNQHCSVGVRKKCLATACSHILEQESKIEMSEENQKKVDSETEEEINEAVASGRIVDGRPIRILLHSLYESTRCLGYHQALGHEDAAEEWLKKSEELLESIISRADFVETPFAYCYTDVNGKPVDFCHPPECASEGDLRVITPLYKSNKDVPDNCRDKLQSEGKPYPRSDCVACGKGIAAGCPLGFESGETK